MELELIPSVDCTVWIPFTDEGTVNVVEKEPPKLADAVVTGEPS